MSHLRWNSTLDLLTSIFTQKKAVVGTLGNMDNPPVEFTSADWKKMEQVINVLQIFKDATESLSFRDASISMGIPIVTSIITDLADETEQDVGVLGLMRDLKKAMETRFQGEISLKLTCVLLCLLGQA